MDRVLQHRLSAVSITSSRRWFLTAGHRSDFLQAQGRSRRGADQPINGLEDASLDLSGDKCSGFRTNSKRCVLTVETKGVIVFYGIAVDFEVRVWKQPRIR